MTDTPKPNVNDLLRAMAASPNRIVVRGDESRDELNRALRRAAGQDVAEHNLPPPFPWKSVADLPDDETGGT
jgi:hypothetical protein